jgi:hypothetical protein
MGLNREMPTMSEVWSAREWKALYTSAMLESDPMKLRQRMEKADAAIRARLEELTDSALGSEQNELLSALKYLGLVKDSPVD